MSNETSNIVHQRSDSAPQVPAVVPAMDGIEPAALVLNKKQSDALEMIMTGKTTVAIAEELKVDRGTIYRWKRFNPNFIAALNQWRGDLHGEIRDRVLTIVEKAADAVERAIPQQGRLGLTLLEKTGSLKFGPKNPVDAHAVFGEGLEDEAVRGPIGQNFQRISSVISLDQRKRAPQLLALGIAIEDRLNGRINTPAEIIELAGPLFQQLLQTDGSIADGLAKNSLQSHVDKQGTSVITQETRPPDAEQEQPVVEVKARVAGYGHKGSFHCSRATFTR